MFTKEELEAIYQLADNAQAKGTASKRMVLAIMLKIEEAFKPQPENRGPRIVTETAEVKL